MITRYWVCLQETNERDQYHAEYAETARRNYPSDKGKLMLVRHRRGNSEFWREVFVTHDYLEQVRRGKVKNRTLSDYREVSDAPDSLISQLVAERKLDKAHAEALRKHLMDLKQNHPDQFAEYLQHRAVWKARAENEKGAPGPHIPQWNGELGDSPFARSEEFHAKRAQKRQENASPRNVSSETKAAAAMLMWVKVIGALEDAPKPVKALWERAQNVFGGKLTEAVEEFLRQYTPTGSQTPDIPAAMRALMSDTQLPQQTENALRAAISQLEQYSSRARYDRASFKERTGLVLSFNYPLARLQGVQQRLRSVIDALRQHGRKSDPHNNARRFAMAVRDAYQQMYQQTGAQAYSGHIWYIPMPVGDGKRSMYRIVRTWNDAQGRPRFEAICDLDTDGRTVAHIHAPSYTNLTSAQPIEGHETFETLSDLMVEMLQEVAGGERVRNRGGEYYFRPEDTDKANQMIRAIAMLMHAVGGSVNITTGVQAVCESEGSSPSLNVTPETRQPKYGGQP